MKMLPEPPKKKLTFIIVSIETKVVHIFYVPNVHNITTNIPDAALDDNYGQSGIATYYFSKDGQDPWQLVSVTSGEETSTYSYTDLTSDTNYTFSVKVEDKAGNMSDASASKAHTPTDSLEGCYADINHDGQVDGIIYADLMYEGNGPSRGSANCFGWEAETGNLKKYEKTRTDTSFAGVERDVIAAVPGSTGKDRFYVMALDDVDTSAHYWYYWGYLKGFPNTSTEGISDFGQGKENTQTMIAKWNAKAYGDGSDSDLWGVIQSKEVKAKYPLNKWFVPSKSEWCAFYAVLSTSRYDNGFGLLTSGLLNSGLKSGYWTSSVDSRRSRMVY